MARLQPRDRVGVVGTGMVGASFAYSLMQSGLANELILIDADAAGRGRGHGPQPRPPLRRLDADPRRGL